MTGGHRTRILTRASSFIWNNLLKTKGFGVLDVFFFFPAAGAEITAAYRNSSEMRHLNLKTQVCLKLLTSDPHKAVSVAEAAFKRILQLGRLLFDCSCWQHTQKPDWGGRTSRSWCSTKPSSAVWLLSLYLDPPNPPPHSTGGTICPVICGYEPVDTEVCSPQSGAVTHQGAVVQEGCGEVAAEAEGQDVPLPGAEGHFAFWKGKAWGERCSVGLEPTQTGQQQRSWAPRPSVPASLTAQPWHTGVVNFEVRVLQVLHGQMRME